MKGRITTVLSLTGVLVAGSAAALVNTQVLQSTESKSNSQVVVGSATDGSEQTNAVSATKIQSSLLTSTQAMYQIGDAGLVTLDTAGDVLTIVSVEPSAGWTVVKAENYSANNIELKLQSGNVLIEFKANLDLGEITTSVESKFAGSDDSDGQTPGTGTTPGSGSIDDDDDDIEVDVTIKVGVDDDHEDEHEDDEDHGEDDD